MPLQLYTSPKVIRSKANREIHTGNDGQIT